MPPIDLNFVAFSYSWKLRKNGISTLVLIDRGFGKVRYFSTGWPAAEPDCTMVNSSALFSNSEWRRRFVEEYGQIIGDQGFKMQSHPEFICPLASKCTPAGRRAFAALSDAEKKWSKKVSAAEARIEDSFAEIFRNEFALVRRRPFPVSTDCRRILPELITASFIMYNMQIDDRGYSILDPVVTY